MKQLTTFFGTLAICLTVLAGEDFINSDALIFLDGSTKVAHRVLITGGAADKLFVALSSQGKKEIKTDSEITINGENMTCVKHLSPRGDGYVLEKLCMIDVK